MAGGPCNPDNADFSWESRCILTRLDAVASQLGDTNTRMERLEIKVDNITDKVQGIELKMVERDAAQDGEIKTIKALARREGVTTGAISGSTMGLIINAIITAFQHAPK